MLVEFVDGSKTMVEMVALANATGLRPDIAGMHGPDAPLDSLHQVFCPKEEGGLLKNIVLGIVGGIIGGGLVQVIGGQGVNGFNLYSFLVAVLGAVIVIWLARLLSGKGK